MNHKLEIDSIILEFDSRRILSDVYLKCESGKITGLLGRNGYGKTCLMNIIHGSLAPTNKSIRLDGVSINQTCKIANLLLYLPQFNFIPKELALKRVFSDFNLAFSPFEQLFPEFETKYYSRIKDLSGGQRRLVEIYVVICSESKFALLDEPFSHLSPIFIEAIKDLILKEKKNKGILVTDHLYRHIIEISDELYVISDGKTQLIKDLDEIEFLGYARL